MHYSEFLSRLPRPVRAALEFGGVDSFEKLTRLNEWELLRMHGIGKKGLEIMKRLLADEGLSLRADDN